MDAIVTRHLGVEQHARQRERHEPRAVRGSQPREDPMKFKGIFQPVQGRRFHSTKQHVDVLRLRARDDLRKIAFHLRHGHAVQTVVGAQREDKHAGACDQGRVEAPQSVGCGIAPHAGVDDHGAQAAPVQSTLQMSWEAQQP